MTAAGSLIDGELTAPVGAEVKVIQLRSELSNFYEEKSAKFRRIRATGSSVEGSKASPVMAS